MQRFTQIFVLLVILGFGATGSYAEMIQIKGSDTLINLVQRLAEEYMDTDGRHMVAVTGGGSGTGVAALINGRCDVANSSRPMKEHELKQAEARGVTPQEVVIAMDGLSVIVHPDNTVDKLTVAEIGKIFRGEATNWSELGGPDMPITLYGRQSNSGTFIFFRDAVLKGDYSPKMNHMNGNAQITEAIKQDRSGIGYVGVGYVKNEPSGKILKVATEAGGVYASPLNSEEVKSGAYPIARPLNQYVNGSPGGAVKDFLAFELSPEGQAIVESEGFFPIPAEYEAYNARLGLSDSAEYHGF